MNSTTSVNLNARIVIVGGGHAGGAVASFLRQYGHAGPILIFGDEPDLPYQRPPLSKAWLKGEVESDDLLLRPSDWYEGAGVEVQTRAVVVDIDPVARVIRTDADQAVPYDILILATGARARALVLPGAGLANVLSLRTAEDATRLKGLLGPGRRLAVVGGGYVGLEVAASARALGSEVTVIEREPRLLARVACPPLSEFFERQHRSRGVSFIFDARVAELKQGPDGVDAILLEDGRVIECDVVVVGIGATPNIELALKAGLACDEGVSVDWDARTSNDHIFAIGDVTRRPTSLSDQLVRLESVPNALEQARQAACAILGRARPAPEVPWFWSDQYDVKLQIAGLPHDADRQVLRGRPETGQFAVFHLKGSQIQAVEAVNSPAEFMAGRLLIGRGTVVDPGRLADLSLTMKEVMA